MKRQTGGCCESRQSKVFLLLWRFFAIFSETVIEAHFLRCSSFYWTQLLQLMHTRESQVAKWDMRKSLSNRVDLIACLYLKAVSTEAAMSGSWGKHKQCLSNVWCHVSKLCWTRRCEVWTLLLWNNPTLQWWAGFVSFSYLGCLLLLFLKCSSDFAFW